MGCGSSSSTITPISISHHQHAPSSKTDLVENISANDDDDNLTVSEEMVENQYHQPLKMSSPKHDIFVMTAADQGGSLSDIEEVIELPDSRSNARASKVHHAPSVNDGSSCGSNDSLREMGLFH